MNTSETTKLPVLSIDAGVARRLKAAAALQGKTVAALRRELYEKEVDRFDLQELRNKLRPEDPPLKVPHAIEAEASVPAEA